MVTTNQYGDLPKKLEKEIRNYMSLHKSFHNEATGLVEDTANALDLYEDHIEYTIPEKVFEIALEFFPGD